jgi:hypothetical protein
MTTPAVETQSPFLAATLARMVPTAANQAPHVVAQINAWLHDHQDVPLPGTRIPVVDITPRAATVAWFAGTVDAEGISDTLLALLTLLANATDGDLQTAGLPCTRTDAATTLHALIPLFVDRTIEVAGGEVVLR